MTVALSKLNFRDIGGLPAADGRVVRSGLIYRSEGPASFFEAHREELGALGIRAVCDLRSAIEREAAPNDWCGPGCRVLNMDMNTDLRAAGARDWESLRDDLSEANARRVISRNYSLMPAAFRPHLRPMVDALLGGEVPMIVHCTAGKDRTGVAVAVLLSLLGVSRELILSDYARSDVFARNLRLTGSVDHAFQNHFGFVPPDTVMDLLIGVQPDFLGAALDEMNREWGSVSGYFAAAGVDAGRQQRISQMLLEQNTADRNAPDQYAIVEQRRS
jgi:protein-tyrosine phosphatase